MSSELADLFELMHGAPESFRTLRATIRTWSDAELGARAGERWLEQVEAGGDYIGIAGACGGCCDIDGDSWEAFEHVWMELPDRIRHETAHDLRIRNGSTQWYESQGDVWESEVVGPVVVEGELSNLLNPLAGMPALGGLEILGSELVAGRQGVRVRAQVRPDVELDPRSMLSSPVARGAEGCELVLDSEHGFCLRRTSLLEGGPLAVIEFTELELDQTLDLELFRSRGQQAAPVHQRPKTLEEAAARASFTVLVPGLIWPGATMSVMHTPAADAWDNKEELTLFYNDTEPGRWCVLTECVAGGDALPDGQWESVELAGVEAFVGVPDALPSQYSTDHGVQTPIVLHTTREGTHIEMQGWGLETAELLGLAASLEPARTAPPPGFF